MFYGIFLQPLVLIHCNGLARQAMGDDQTIDGACVGPGSAASTDDPDCFFMPGRTIRAAPPIRKYRFMSADQPSDASLGAANDAQILRVLVVDDNADSARTLAWVIELEGYEVGVCLSGTQAVEMARSFRPHVVLLDLGMPGMNGYDVCKALRADATLRHVKIIAQTGWSDAAAKRKTAESGFDLHLVKPVNMAVLNDMLDLLAHTAGATRRQAA
jgi:two-component system CheB/CheR fusion protein